MAYMDGQMSASEALEFERSLSPEDQKRLNDEVRLEAAICDSLAGGECCPIALWKGLALRMRNQAPQRSRIAVWQRRIVAVAAAVAIVTISTVAYREFVQDPNTAVALGLGIMEDSLEDFANNTEVPGTQEAMQRYLDDHKIALKLVDFDSAKLDPHHPVTLLGAGKGICPESNLVEVRLVCCEEPIKLLIAKVGTKGARLIRRAKRCGTVRTSRVTDGFVTALVGDIHGNTDLLNLLQPNSTNLV